MPDHQALMEAAKADGRGPKNQCPKDRTHLDGDLGWRPDKLHNCKIEQGRETQQQHGRCHDGVEAQREAIQQAERLTVAGQRIAGGEQRDNGAFHCQRQREGNTERGQLQLGLSHASDDGSDSEVLRRHEQPTGRQRQPEAQDGRCGQPGGTTPPGIRFLDRFRRH